MSEKMILELHAKLREHDCLINDPETDAVSAAVMALLYDEARTVARKTRLSAFCGHVKTDEQEMRFADGYVANALRTRGRDMCVLLRLGYALGVHNERSRSAKRI